MEVLVKKTVHVIMMLVVLALFIGCSSTQVGPVYMRPDVDTSSSNILVMPMLKVSGDQDGPSLADNEEFSVPTADTAMLNNIKGQSEGKVVPVPKSALDKIDGAYEAIDKIVKLMDKSSSIEQVDPEGGVTEFLQSLTSQFGDGAVAFGLVFVGEEEFKEAKQDIPVNIGLFHTKKLTWKWITKASVSPGLIPEPYKKLVNDAISESFKKLEQEL